MTLTSGVAERLFGAQAEVDLLGERDGERVVLDRRAIGAAGGRRGASAVS